MPESNLALYMASELAALLLLVTIFLLVHVSKLKKLIKKLEAKILSLRQSMGIAKKDAQEAKNALELAQSVEPIGYRDFLDQQIEDSRGYHQNLNPDRDIVLDISTDSPIDRQAVALRHAFLIAEKEASYSGEDDVSDWEVLQSKFQQIIQFYADAAEPTPIDDDQLDSITENADSGDDHEEEIAGYKKRIENLERFKKLFFDMEAKWRTAKKDADAYQEELLQMGKELGAGEDFEGLLSRYANSYGDVESLMKQGAADSSAGSGEGGPGNTIIEIDARRSDPGKTIITNQEEMDRLRNMAVDQHKVITELKRKLQNADSAEEQREAIEGLSKQLEQQERFLKEAETCTQLLEDELNRALEENQQLRESAESGGAEGASEEDLAKMETLIAELTEGSRDMLKTIAALEDENCELQSEMMNQAASSAAGMPEGAGVLASPEAEELQKKLVETQQELLNLQTQHIELEERYLELKMESL